MTFSHPRLGLLAPLVAVALLAGTAASASTPTTTNPSSSTTSTVPASTSTVPATTTTVRTPPTPGNPFANSTIIRYLRSRSNNVTVGLYNPSTGRTYLYRPGVHELTASMVKMDILADLLSEVQAQHRHLSAAEQSLVTVMIEDSDNNAAQELWNDIGGYGLSSETSGNGGYYAISNFNRRVGFTQTITNWGWGLMNTTPTDYLRLLKTIWLPSKILTPASQAYERYLMEHVTASQRFGIPNGVPANAVVGNKNGWYPEATGWQINSAGYVHLGRVAYMAVVMTSHNPDESYGMDTVNTVGALLWHYENQFR